MHNGLPARRLCITADIAADRDRPPAQMHKIDELATLLKSVTMFSNISRRSNRKNPVTE
jgi:hypothetical protein